MNYKQTTVIGERWNRFGRVEVANPLGGVATIALSEQSVLELGADERIVQEVGCLHVPYDPTETFPLLDQTTGAETKIVSSSDVYAYLQSYAIHRAKLRDAAVISQLAAGGTE